MDCLVCSMLMHVFPPRCPPSVPGSRAAERELNLVRGGVWTGGPAGTSSPAWPTEHCDGPLSGYARGTYGLACLGTFAVPAFIVVGAFREVSAQ